MSTLTDLLRDNLKKSKIKRFVLPALGEFLYLIASQVESAHDHQYANLFIAQGVKWAVPLVRWRMSCAALVKSKHVSAPSGRQEAKFNVIVIHVARDPFKSCKLGPLSRFRNTLSQLRRKDNTCVRVELEQLPF